MLDYYDVTIVDNHLTRKKDGGLYPLAIIERDSALGSGDVSEFWASEKVGDDDGSRVGGNDSRNAEAELHGGE